MAYAGQDPTRPVERVKGWPVTWDPKPTAEETVNLPTLDEWRAQTRKYGQQGQTFRSRLMFGEGEIVVITHPPFPRWPIQCQQVKRDGGQCSKRAAPGTVLCGTHDNRYFKLVTGTRKYLSWVLLGSPKLIGATPQLELLTVEAVATEILKRRHPKVSDHCAIQAASLLLKTLDWADRQSHRAARVNPMKALVDECGLTSTQAEQVHKVLASCGWLPQEISYEGL